MNIDNFKNTETDLGRFLNFADNLHLSWANKDLSIEKEDWDNMCGIFIVDDSYFERKTFLFNFYDDGTLRIMNFGCTSKEAKIPKTSKFYNLIDTISGWISFKIKG